MAITDSLNSGALFNPSSMLGSSSGLKFGDINGAMPSSWGGAMKPLQGLSGEATKGIGDMMKRIPATGIAKDAATKVAGSGLGVAGYAGLATSAIGSVSNISNILSGDGPSYKKNAAAVQAGVDGVSSALAATGPWGMAAAAVIKGIDIGGKYLRTVPTAVKNFGVNEDLNKSGAFSGTMDSSMELKDQANTMSKGGFFAGLTFNRAKMAEKARQMTFQQNTATGIKRGNDIAKDAAVNSTGMISNATMQRQQGINPSNVAFGKKGMKIINKKDYIDLFNSILKPTTQKFENGGKISVIANGVLHEEENNISENEKFKDADITENGIPVISFEDGGEIKQHAEVEKDELVLNLDITKSLEDLFHDGEEKDMIKAGKMFAKEIIKNTKDSNTEIIKNA